MNKFGFTAKDVIGTGMEIEQYIVYASHLAARSGRKGTRKKFTLLKFIETKVFYFIFVIELTFIHLNFFCRIR